VDQFERRSGLGELAPYIADVARQVLGVHAEVRAPDLSVEHRVVQYESFVAHQELQQLELRLGEPQFALTPPCLPGARGDAQRPRPQHGTGSVRCLGFRCGPRHERGPAQQRPQPGEQFGHLEGLGQIVVGAGVQSGGPVGDFGARGEHQHRCAVTVGP
jgi:hypothetical protein